MEAIFLVYVDYDEEHSLAACFTNVVDAEEFIKLRTEDVDKRFCFTITEMRIGTPSNFELAYRLQTKIFETDDSDIDRDFDRMRALYQHQQGRFKTFEDDEEGL